MYELQKLIRETDRRSSAAFEETFEATARNFEELVEHMFPGGRGTPAAGRGAADARGPCSAARRPRPRRRERRRGPPRPRRGADEPEERGARRLARRGDRGHAGRQGHAPALAALRRREVAGRARLRLRRLPRPAVALLHPRRGRGRARRRQHRPLPAARPPLLRSRPVRDRHPPEAHDGRRRRPLRRLDGQGGVDQGDLAPPAAGRQQPTLAEAPAAEGDEAEAA